MLKTGRFTRDQHIKHSGDIRMLFKMGKRVSTNGAKLFFFENKLEKNRIAFVLPRCYGNAVQRNHSKRISREAYRQIHGDLLSGYDLLLLVYPGNDIFSYRCTQINSLCKKAGLLQI